MYQQIIIALPKYPSTSLVTTFKNHANVIFQNGGIYRGIEHHGIRPLPERATRKYAASDGQRHYWDGRFISALFDASPACLKASETYLRGDDGGM